MDFVIQWLSYLGAFVAGSAVAWMIASVVIRRGANQHVPANVSVQEVSEGR